MQENKPKILVFINKNIFKHNPKGGPLAVCHMYYKEQMRRQDNSFDFLNLPLPNKSVNNAKRMVRKLPAWFVDLERQIRKTPILIERLNPQSIGVDFSEYDIVHFHDTYSLFNEKDKLDTYKGIVVLQSHSPQPWSHECYEKEGRITKLLIPKYKKRLEAIDEYAFNRADYIIFPCEDAQEPYFTNWDFFNKNKSTFSAKTKYVLTGIEPAKPNRTRKDVCEELNIPETDFIMCYIGRHNEVKGFDNLKEIASDIFNTNKNAWVISAGKEEPIKRLVHPHWKEIGWTTDAHSYIAASDVFILPNKETYFDIVMLEILSLGKIVVASRTGGNKYFEKHGVQGVFLYDTLDEAKVILSKISNMSKAERDSLGMENYKYFNENLTVSSMYDNYVNVMGDIYTEEKQ